MPKITSASPLFAASWAFSQEPKSLETTFLTPSLSAIEVTKSGAAPTMRPCAAQATGGYAGCPVITNVVQAESACAHVGSANNKSSGKRYFFIAGFLVCREAQSVRVHAEENQTSPAAGREPSEGRSSAPSNYIGGITRPGGLVS